MTDRVTDIQKELDDIDLILYDLNESVAYDSMDEDEYHSKCVDIAFYDGISQALNCELDFISKSNEVNWHKINKSL